MTCATPDTDFPMTAAHVSMRGGPGGRMDFISYVRRASEQLNQIRAGAGSRAEPEVGLSTLAEGGSADSTCHKPLKNDTTPRPPLTTALQTIPAERQKSFCASLRLLCVFDRCAKSSQIKTVCSSNIFFKGSRFRYR